MPQESGPAFIDRNRPSRVEISYQLYTGGAQEKVELPFLMGIMADLSGTRVEKDDKAKEPGNAPESVNERKFIDIDVDNFNSCLKKIGPRAVFAVKNTLGGEPEMLSVDLAFESLGDFEPDKIVRKIPKLLELLEKREQLARLLANMDGKESAEKLVGKLLTDKAYREKYLGSAAKPSAQAEPASNPPEVRD